MTKIAGGWVWDGNVEALVSLLSLIVGYDFDGSDWQAIKFGLDGTDDKRADGWYAYPLQGSELSLEVRLARCIGSDVVSVTVYGAKNERVSAQTEILLTTLSSYRVQQDFHAK